MNELILTDSSWDSNSKLKVSPFYTNWKNEHGALDVMEIEAYDSRFNDSVSVNIHLKDMVKLHKFLGEKLDFIRKSDSYKGLFDENGELKL